jgi:hypothetical protein
MRVSSSLVIGISDTPGADGCITESILKGDLEGRLGGSKSADSVGAYDDIA